MPSKPLGVKPCLVALLFAFFTSIAVADSWVALGAGVSGGSVNAIAVDTNTGAVYVGGAFTSAGGVANTNYIAKWNGTDWAALGTGMNGAVKTLVIDASGNVYAGGSFTSADAVANTAYIAKWNGSSWSGLGSGMSGGTAVNALVQDSSGNLYAGGTFTVAGGIAALGFAKWNGSSWSAPASFSSAVLSLAIDSVDNIYATATNGVTVNKWNGSSWSSLPYLTCTSWGPAPPYPGGKSCNYSTIGAVGVGSDGNVYAAINDAYNGYHTSYPNSLTVSKWNGVAWSVIYAKNFTFGGDNVRAFAMDSASTLYFGNSTTPSINKKAFNGSVTALGGDVTGGSGGPFVNAIATNGSNVYVGGNFATAGALAANNIAVWFRDADNDGVGDASDAFPLNAAESLDTDLDGIGNNADLDDDGDNVPDYIDAAPLSAANSNEMTLPLNNGYKGSQLRDSSRAQ